MQHTKLGIDDLTIVHMEMDAQLVTTKVPFRVKATQKSKRLRRNGLDYMMLILGVPSEWWMEEIHKDGHGRKAVATLAMFISWEIWTEKKCSHLLK
jgi:hypothetical protein